MGALISFAWLLSWVSRSHVFKKRAGERRRYPASLCSLSSGRLLPLITLIVPRVDSSIHSFWSTRHTLGLVKACGEVSYWTQDCFLIPGTLTILVNRTPIQLPAWAFFSCRILAGLNFQSECADAREGFFLFLPSLPPTPTPFTASLLSWKSMPRATCVKHKWSVGRSSTACSSGLNDLMGKSSPHLFSSFNYEAFLLQLFHSHVLF